MIHIVIKLWEQGAPYFNPEYGQGEPELTFFPAKASAGTAAPASPGCVIVCPGGGYAHLAPHEGAPIAEMYNAAGIHAAVLRYRISPYRHPAMLSDVNRAVRVIRHNAGNLGLSPDKIAVLGFSAGGHLAVSAIEHFDYGHSDGDETDRVSCRPDAGILCYPVVSFYKFGHTGSMKNLLGENPDEELRSVLSGENSVRDDTPPAFIWHTAADAGVPVENSLMLASALSAKKIPFELHVFPDGAHGLGLASGLGARDNPHVAQWAPLSVNWLKLLGF